MISIIVATDLNGGIGKDNKLLFHIKEDMQRFKELTSNHTVIMGRKTQESLPQKFLPNRNNIVLTKTNIGTKLGLNYKIEYMSNIEEIISRYFLSDEEVFVIGGASIYKQFLPYTDKIYLTYVEDEKESDSYFNLDELHSFKPTNYEPHETENGFRYSFIDYERLSK